MACLTTNKILCFCLIIALALLAVSLALAFKIFPDIVDEEIDKNVRLENGTEQFDRFMKLPFPLQFKVYVFHVENAEKVSNGALPIVTEKGPYIYNQFRQKISVDSDDSDDDTITYTQNEAFVFDDIASSPLKQDDMFTVLDPAMMSIYQIAERMKLASVVSGCINYIFPDRGYNLFLNVTVRDLLFNGIRFSPPKPKVMLCLGGNMVFEIVRTIAKDIKFVDETSDGWLKFSYFNYKDHATDGVYTVKSGLQDVEKLGEIVKWNDNNYTDFWGTETECSRIKGTDSTIYRPRIEDSSQFSIYSTDICRTVEINYIKEATYKGIDGYLFGTNNRTLYPTASTPEQDCYCTNQTLGTDGKQSCFLDGIIDMQTCTKVPVLLSFPHFLWANESYIQNVTGMKPDEELHKTFLLVEPNTGTPLQGMKRIQMNAVFRPISGVKEFEQFSSFVLPLLWIEEGFSMPDLYIDQLNSMYFNKLRILEGVKWGLIAVTGFIAAVLFGILARRKMC